jgi:hypothetical protein
MLKMLYYHACRVDIEDNNDKAEMISELIGPEFQELGTGTNRIAFLYSPNAEREFRGGAGLVFEFALDRRGFIDNFTEFKRSMECPMYFVKAYETNISIIATPLLDIGDKIALVYYNKFTQQVSHCVLDNESLSIFTHISAYCNGNNMLFISGGETTSSNYHNAFYAIDLFNSDKTEQLPNLNEARGWHSMLYVPNSFVFIVGGTSKAVEVYDIDKGTIVCDSEINELRRETTLCLVNNALLYCFGGFVFEDECFSTTVERCNLRESKRKWVYVNYIQNDNSFFDECYYLASYYTNDAIVLFKVVESDNGNESECGGIVFDFENEDKPIINSFNNTDVVTGIFNEKFVIPIANNCKVVFPMITDKVVLYTCESNCQIKEKVYSNILNELL